MNDKMRVLYPIYVVVHGQDVRVFQDRESAERLQAMLPGSRVLLRVVEA